MNGIPHHRPRPPRVVTAYAARLVCVALFWVLAAAMLVWIMPAFDIRVPGWLWALVWWAGLQFLVFALLWPERE